MLRITALSSMALALALAACKIEDTAFQATPDGGGTISDVLAIQTSTASFDVDEGGMATFTVRLTQAPGAELTVRIAPADTGSDARIGISLPELRFLPTNFDQPQSITVTGVVDVDTLDGLASISLTADGVDPVTLSATVRDHDKVEIVSDIAASGVLTINETRSVDVHVHLTHQPAADVRVVAAIDGGDVVTVSPGQVTFTAQTYDRDQVFTFTARDDINVVDETLSLTFRATGLPDRQYTIHDLDKDKLNLSVTPSQSITVNEGGGKTLSIALTKQPAASVTVHLATERGNVGLSRNDLMFTPQNFDTAQQVTVTAAPDDNATSETDQITISITGSDVTPVMIGVTTIDDDVQAILHDAPNPLSVTENQTVAFGVTLKFQPTATMTVQVDTLASGVAIASPGTLTFTPQNYSDPTVHQVTVRGSDDNNVTPSSTSVRLREPTLVDVLVPVNVADDDTQQIMASPAMLSVVEGMTGTFNVSLKFDPGTTVTASLANTNQAALPISRTSITFTGGAGGNWATPVAVTVSPPIDSNAVSETGTVTISGAGAPSPATVALTASDPTVIQPWGWPNPFTSSTTVSAGFAFAYRINLGAVATLGAFHVWVPTGVGLFRMALYSDVGGNPGRLVAQMGAGKVMVDGVNDGAPLNAVMLGDPTYWLVVRFSADVAIGYDAPGASVNRCFGNSPYATIGDAWANDFNDRTCGNDHLFNIWITTFHQ